jgi:hypothetical protein
MKNMPLPELPDAVLEAYRGLFEQKFQTWPDAVREALVARHLAGWRAGFLEGRNMEEVCEELRAGGGTPEVPMTVVTTMAVDPAQRAFTPDEVQREVNAGKHTLNALLAGSVAGGRHLVLMDAAHAWVTMDQGDAVVEAIDDLLHQASG